MNDSGVIESAGHALSRLFGERDGPQSQAMFRKPRNEEAVKPSTGRPPTPPAAPAKTPFSLARPSEVPAPKMAATKMRSSKPVPLPTIGRQGLAGSAKKSTVAAKAKSAKPNGSILSFFKKTDGPEEPGLFVEEMVRNGHVGRASPEVQVQHNEEEDDDEDDRRFNESVGSVKRQKTGGLSDEEAELFGESPVKRIDPHPPVTQPRSGPFMEESDSEDEQDEQPAIMIPVKQEDGVEPLRAIPLSEPEVESAELDLSVVQATGQSSRPLLIKEETSYGPDLDEFRDFEDMGDFDEDPFEQGDEFMERRYMEEQAKLEEEDEKDYDPVPDEESVAVQAERTTPRSGVDAALCPICSISLADVSEQDAGVHVNNCLDGNPSPLPERKQAPAKKTPWLAPEVKFENTSSATQFKRPQPAPKPGQANPFTLGETSLNGGSAFNKLMSGHAEDAAWAEAAAAEHSARGKPSYQRTCPFYKILPGLSICVDAFRYGAVQGCQAYFLSHFHSDHYVGLTSSWNHGPIYCSKVTANLVKQQLRVDPQFVIPLEFDRTIEVPGTKGVRVTMIPANHCPGSSLYLFEKIVGKKSNGESRLQRILHCGDFRACRAHVQHPLLMPDVQDKLTGKTTKEQKIDVCYLDTTYLNPKYAFPSQSQVIQACADMCVSLSKHTVDEDDGWEQMKKRRAGEGMVKFVRKESQPETKEEDVGGDCDNIKLERNPNASQQIIRSNSLPDAKQGRGRLLVVVGTYSIGKERICLGIAKALNSKIYAPTGKQRIVAALEDPELNALMTTNPREAQVHMTPLFEIRADTLDDYLKDYFPHFTRAVGFRPSGWNYRPPNSRFIESPTVQTVLNGDNWKSPYSMKDLTPQRGSTGRASCFGVPYSEHSSFRELTMFCCALRIEKIVPTVNVGSAKSRERMKAWCERWAAERRKNGLWKLPEDGSW
ncbi:DNA repair metallo-beta-lactamase [Teratosphaeria destructans]|uniref:DNA repair metallo-beta-lactamase n=1 Tax=Teratosphaeria destructans TaxID=418781 RepID=A0A9W7T1V3_9PEZI|nr:DNA repair metallo-beta-lactamase [Teratosphaeria destructans]